ncbi:MAG: helix-turn-helix domain-containing protein, partial [Alphaproteobacteria bacterium]|nr:helix-turn-helix domain-containing protein [Alphaproteobacteria bacterium]
DAAVRALEKIETAILPPSSRAIHELAAAGIAIRRLEMKSARAALERADGAARRAGIPALIAETEAAARTLNAPAARLIARHKERPLRLDEVEALFASRALVVDACRYAVREKDRTIALATRPVLFALARAFAEAWPNDVSRATLVARAFRAKEADESHRARLRVEIGRLRRLLRTVAAIDATKDGFRLLPHHARRVAVLAQPVEDENAAVLALLADGKSWSSSALALALGASQRSVQRALDALTRSGRIQPVGRGRARRWMTPHLSGFATALLLPTPFPGG